ncbi:beta-1,4-mannosyltransferase, glycosyltransferase family 33 protein [Rhizoctonia solani]|uniref:Chitobiosyldiphosphodolichol beta-mannosyltransferase n=1 Tax=Rhizoctonia solani TaxID=456999 RepID=A0A8H8NUB6_9AGAM|nr:beta-1,4-mannosyltransferase, glycosyltransferase family 33 protein [Rhizoctonia solani]QRW18978.1 beta-1,4-mannosyltransferase, glycosyltransferase family 33 protein [Rhizoctonia solani]
MEGFNQFVGSTLIKALRELPSLTMLPLTPPPRLIGELPRQLFILAAPIKLAIQAVSLLWALLFKMPTPEYILVQNPPSIPTLVLVQLVCWLRGCKLVIDWHNLGYSILALRLGEKHRLVKVAKLIERIFGRRAFLHLFVTDAMKKKLVQEWNLEGQTLTLHDRPPSHFRRSTPVETHDASTKFPGFSPVFLTKLPPTHHIWNSITRGPPALIVSSTSWTPDEDFSLFLEMLKQYEHRARQGGLPKLLALITGKGPLRDYYMKEISRLEKVDEWEWVRCVSVWLEPEDYPVLLGSADLGVSLHSSSSGLDLPMKVVDMFGCSLPVCALDFECLDELVKDGVNGLTFKTADELIDQVQKLFSNFPDTNQLDVIRQSLKKEPVYRPLPRFQMTIVRNGTTGQTTGTHLSGQYYCTILPIQHGTL